MLDAFLFCRTDYESALGRSAPEPDPSGGMAMIAPILKRTPLQQGVCNMQ
jgi:hypothetical protein